MTTPARVAAALRRLGLSEMEAQARGLNLHPDHAPLEVRGLLDGSESLDEPDEAPEEAPEEELVQAAPEQLDDVEEAEADEADADESEPVEAEDEPVEDEDADEASEPEAEPEKADNPADGVTVDEFEGLATTLTDEQLTAALADSRKGIQVIAQTALDERGE